ncbi:mucin-2 [Mobula birostris]|uniref:mucin-2 n=1 Tax=Mobula birostris TaxID=1983395 RepID=UPI003B28769A
MLSTTHLYKSSAPDVKEARLPNHRDHVCSTWGNNHFKTFDGDVYQFPGTCDYNFVTDCNSQYKEFSIHIKRTISKGHPKIHGITAKIKDIVIYMTPKFTVISDEIVSLPYFGPGFYVEQNVQYTKLYGKFGLTLMWNREDALMVELDVKYHNQTCGLCGDYNGIPVYNEFTVDGQQFSPIQFGNLQKIHLPNEKCQDVDEQAVETSSLCEQYREACGNLLSRSSFSDCKFRLNNEHYIRACMLDMCSCEKVLDSFCLCSTVSEYSRQCSHAGGKPENWRTETFCPKRCPLNMIYKESGSPCMDSCSHLHTSRLCEEHYMDGCFCPPGMVIDDYSDSGCVKVEDCKCTMKGKHYNSGTLLSTECEECVCSSGKWLCKNLPCPGTCSFEGGAHVSTFDGMKYTFHGNCYYILSKDCDQQHYTLLAEIVSCGTTPTETCLKTVVLSTDHKHNILVFKDSGNVIMNGVKVTLPLVTANYTVFKPSTFHILLESKFGLQLQVQLVPRMQVYVTLDQSYKGKICGFCGNFNDILHDDFKASNGLVEGTATPFANSWKAQRSCSSVSEHLEDPCAISTENQNYAEYWCSFLKEPGGVFSHCHSTISPTEYYKKCKYDSCNCYKNEDCMCAAIYSYVRACASKGVILTNWRTNVCSSYTKTCPETLTYDYDMKSCRRTCHSLSEKDVTCGIQHISVDGCGCLEGTYMNEEGKCVPSFKCPCLYQGSLLNPGEVIRIGDTHCCNTTEPGVTGAECHRTCGNQNLDCYSEKCVSGCVCPEGLLDDGTGNCVKEEKCPCMHNSFHYHPGSRITVDCNTCTCQKGNWKCTDIPCFGACKIYGSGHYITFDGLRYNFEGNCEYVATQDYCGVGHTNGTFSVITENVPCGTTGTTCSKSIKLFFQNFELKLAEGKHEVIQRNENKVLPFTVRTVGLYLTVETTNGLIIIWDKKTSIFIKLSPSYQGNICGLCGNFDGNANNDLMTRSQSVVTNITEFGNSWKMAATCPDAVPEYDPCIQNPHRKAWAEKQCGIIMSDVFKNCSRMVDPNPFYEACVHDSCSCDSGGDCECFCTAVAAYANACNDSGICVDWRTPEICPMYCSFYNPSPELCQWHYHPCGVPCFRTCLNPHGLCNVTLQLEGCYPKCPDDAPIFNEHIEQCVAECGCYVNGKYYEINETVETSNNCEECRCTKDGINCMNDSSACVCIYNGTVYHPNEIIYNITDGLGDCFVVYCADNGTIIGKVVPCPTTTTTPLTVSSSSITASTATCVIVEECEWSNWISVSFPTHAHGQGDFETYDKIREHGHPICEAPSRIECRAIHAPEVDIEELEQKVQCNVSFGLICRNEDQGFIKKCYDYEIQVQCCQYICQSPTTASVYNSYTHTWRAHKHTIPNSNYSLHHLSNTSY